MDNAQKAIMIGVGLFITIIIISVVLLITNMGTRMVNTAGEEVKGMNIALQSQLMNAYDNKSLTGSDVNYAIDRYGSNDAIILIVTTGTIGNDLAAASTFSTTSGYTQNANFTDNAVITSAAEGNTDIAASATKLTKINVTTSASYQSYLLKSGTDGSVIGVVFAEI